MWTIGFQPNGCASHAYRAGKSAESMEMLAFAHIPTGATTSKNYNFDSEERGTRGKGFAFAFSVPCRATNRMRGAWAARIKRQVRYFLRRGKKSTGPATPGG